MDRISVIRRCAAVAAALLVAVLPGTTAGAAPGDNPGALTPVPSAEYGKLQLQEHRVAASTISTLDTLLPNVGVDAVLKSANHPMRNTADCLGTEAAALPLKPAVSSAYCWDTGDANTQEWVPQGLTSSGDADDDGLWGTNKVILSGWTNRAGENLARVAFIDANTAGAFKYRWVLLTVPTEGGTNFTNLGSHLGGAVWYGDKLIVTASNGDASHNALFVFSMAHILQASVNGDAVGKTAGGYSAHGYQYIMPATGSYSLSQKCDPDTDDNTPCVAAITLDRTTSPYSLVANEWFSSGGAQPARIFRYQLAAPGGAMPLTVDGNGKANVLPGVLETKAVGLQSVLAYENAYYTADARGGIGQHGILWRLSTAGATSAAGCGTPSACWGKHTEDMSLWWSTKQVWTQTEWAANKDAKWKPEAIPERILFSTPLSAL
jgi:hypothetical protein